MYSIGAYFMEVVIESIPGDGWTADAVFSRRADYKAHARVPKVRYPAHVVQSTKGQAEGATVKWARGFVSGSSDVIESSLRMKTQTNSPLMQRR